MYYLAMHFIMQTKDKQTVLNLISNTIQIYQSSNQIKIMAENNGFTEKVNVNFLKIVNTTKLVKFMMNLVVN